LCGVERDLIAASLDERIINAAEDVDLAGLVQLLFAPQHRVVEHAVAVSMEAAFHRDVVANVDNVVL